MPNSLFLIFNHRLTEIQKKDAHRSLGISRIIDLLPNLEKLWQQVPVDLSEIDDFSPENKIFLAQALKEYWIESQKWSGKLSKKQKIKVRKVKAILGEK